MSTESNFKSKLSLQALVGILADDTLEDLRSDAWKNRPTGIEFSGKKIILPSDPEDMPIDAAIDMLSRKKAEDEMEFQIGETIQGYAYDAAVAFVKAMERIYGWASPQPTPTFFGSRPPQFHTVKTGPNYDDNLQVPMGQFKLPNVEFPINAEINWFAGVYVVTGKCRKRDQKVIKELCELARKIVREESIYKGKALRFKVNDNGTINEGFEPEFIPTAHIDPSQLVLPEFTARLLQTAVYTPIQKTKQAEALNIPLNRGVLLEGPYGVGKSMTAASLSKICVDNGWTYILLDKVQGLKTALEFASRFQPAVVFAEDIDRIAEIRDEKANDLLNTIDGVLSKDSKVITVLTTNHIEKINPAMLRPGRLDAVITFTAPDAEAAIRLVRQYAGKSLAADVDLTEVGILLAGMIPATIREVVERSKLGMLDRGDNAIQPEDLELFATSMTKHLELLNKPKDDKKSVGDRLGDALKEVVIGTSPLNGKAPAISESVVKLTKDMDKVTTYLGV